MNNQRLKGFSSGTTDARYIYTEILLELAFLVFFATFVSYYLIPYGQKQLRPTLVSMYAYVQPIIATAISICIGMDRLRWQKILSALLVFAGVIIVSRSKRRLAECSEKAGCEKLAPFMDNDVARKNIGI